MKASNHPGRILPQDSAPADAAESMIVGQAVSQTEVEDLLYGDDRPVTARVDRLRELADVLRVRQAGEFADDDTGALLDEIDRAIGELTADQELAGEPSMLDGVMAVDPTDHRETLSPDSEELEAIEEVDLDSLSEDFDEDDLPVVLDAEEWRGDGFDPDKGVK